MSSVVEENNIQKSVFSNIIWRFFERVSAQCVKLIVEIVLARILLPQDYGIVALITVITTILQVFVDSGLGNALIQKKDVDDVDYSTVFYTNIFMCIIIYMCLFLLAPYISAFYNNLTLIPYIRVLGLTVIISGIKNVQQAYVSRNMLFKKFFISTLTGTIISGIIGIIMALMGFGVWALIEQQVVNLLLDTIILWFTVKWRPQKTFSIKKLKQLFSYGWKLLIAALLETVYTNIRQLIIGKVYTSTDLAQYNRGEQFPNLMISNVNLSIDSVLMPTMSKQQDDRERVKEMTRRSMKTSIYIIAPLMIGLIFIGTSLVRIILTDKWLESVFYMRFFCVTYMFYPLHTANLNAIKAMGRSDLVLKLEIEKKIIATVALFSTMFISVKAMAYSLLFTSIMSQIINSKPNKKLLNYGYFEQIKDILPSILLALVMGLCIYPISLIGLSDLLIVCIQIPLGVVVYIVLSKLLKFDSYYYLLNVIKGYFNK